MKLSKATISAYVVLLTLQAYAGLEWALVPPPSHSQPLHSITWTGSKFIAVGEAGTIQSSVDGVSWDSCQTDFTSPLKSVASGNGQLIALFYGSTSMLVSDDSGLTWSTVKTDWGYLDEVIWAGTQWVAVGDTRTLFTSVDGRNWIDRRTSSIGESYRNLVWTGTKLFATGVKSNSLLTSSDGIRWENAAVDLPKFRILTWTGLRFIGVGVNDSLYTSEDGAAWTERLASDSVSYLNALVWTGKEAIGLETNGRILKSSDGIGWSESRTDSDGPLFGIAWTGNKYVIVGGNPSCPILNSADAASWTCSQGLPSMKAGYSILSTLWTGKQFVSVGIGPNNSPSVLATSPDGLNWTPRLFDPGFKFRSVAWNGKSFVAVGAKNSIYSSVDGIKWTSRSIQYDSITLTSVAWAHDRWVAVGMIKFTYITLGLTSYIPLVLTSLDGTTWETQDRPPGSALLSAIWTGDQVVAVGQQGTILTSPDGVAWKSHSDTSWSDLFSVNWIDGQLIAAGDNGIIITSTNGSDWIFRNSGTDQAIYSVQKADSLYIAVGSGGTSLVSKDGWNWEQPDKITTQSLFTSVSMGNQVLIYGGGGLIITKASSMNLFQSPALNAPGLKIRRTHAGIFIDWPPHYFGKSVSASIVNLEGKRSFVQSVTNISPDKPLTIPFSQLGKGLHFLVIQLGKKKNSLPIFIP
ncbi:MAG: hypothetical protein ABI036_12905 [Fibrobacteria bacterium]